MMFIILKNSTQRIYAICTWPWTCAWHNYKDNSIKSINNAILNGFNYIKIDIQLCKDGNIVLHHDLFIKDKLVSELTYKEIKGIDNEIITFE